MMPAPNAFAEASDALRFVVIVSADAEWRAVADLFPGSTMERTPYGEFFHHDSGASRGVVMRGGWGKIDAAASAQYGICRWRPAGPADIPLLRRLYQAIAVDWESGAIARVASRNGQRVLMLRGVSDLVSEERTSDTYGRPELFEEASRTIMRHLFDVLPMWIEAAVTARATPA